MKSRKISRQAAKAKAKQEQVERGLLELFKTSPAPRCWSEIISNISASSASLEIALKTLADAKLIDYKTIYVGMKHKKSVIAWYLKEQKI
jgi:hypothetical protein